MEGSRDKSIRARCLCNAGNPVYPRHILLFSVGTTRRPVQREQACAAAERYHKDSSIPQVLAVVELNVTEAFHNGDVEEDRQVDWASFQVPFGH